MQFLSSEKPSESVLKPSHDIKGSWVCACVLCNSRFFSGLAEGILGSSYLTIYHTSKEKL